MVGKVFCRVGVWSFCLRALFVAALFSGFRVVGCPKSASRLSTSGFVHFVGLVFGLFVCALFVAAVFSEFRVRWLPDVDAFRQCFWALRRVGVWSVCLRPVCCGAVFWVSGCWVPAVRIETFRGHFPQVVLCALSDQCLVCLYTPCLLWRCFFFGFGLVGCRVSMFLANIFVRFVVFEDVRQPGACT